MEKIRVRFAPSPTGDLHLGSARTALFNWLYARHMGGQMVLRMEDTDPQRSSARSEQDIIEDLRWLGIDWDEGPDVGGPHAPYRQSERRELYVREARRLAERGEVYFCYCTPEELEAKKQQALAEGRMPLYDGTCRGLTREERERRKAEGRRPALRFRVPPGEIEFTDLLHGRLRFSSEVIGDFVILRSDGTAGFNFSVVVDDAAMDITHVIRGEDHLTNTARHILLYRALGYRIPVFAHHSLLLGADGAKLSKRHGAASVRQFREAGYLPEAVMNYLALLSWSPEGEGGEVLSPVELVGEFRLETLSRSPAIFDPHKLNWLNGQHIRRADPRRLAELAAPFAPGAAWHPLFAEMVASVRDNLQLLSELPACLEVYSEAAPLEPETLASLARRPTLDVLEGLREALLQEERMGLEEARSLLAALAGEFKKRGMKPGEILMPVRLALTGRPSGPPLPYILFILGREECLARLERSLGHQP
jgi:nondiscriminating glutamyl-tRNA synthetase